MALLAAEVCDVPAERIREGARLIGIAERLFSTVLQVFYQSHQATAVPFPSSPSGPSVIAVNTSPPSFRRSLLVEP